MKKKFMYLLATLSIFALTACGKQEPKPDLTNKEPKETEDVKDKEVSDKTDEKEDTDTKKEDTNTKEDATKEGDGMIYDLANTFLSEYPNSELIKLKIKQKSNGDILYEITGMDDEYEYEVLYDEKGIEKKSEKDRLDADDKYEAEVFSLDETENFISFNEAMDIALKEREGIVENITLEKEMNTFIYEVEIEGKHDIDLILDATTGEILSFDD